MGNWGGALTLKDLLVALPAAAIALAALVTALKGHALALKVDLQLNGQHPAPTDVAAESKIGPGK
jgi:hypothetical protein